MAFDNLRAASIGGALALFALPAAAPAETLVGKNTDNRIMVGFQVDPADLARWIPEGWSVLPFPSGPMKGATLMITLEDRLLQMDAEGKPDDPAASRALAFIGLGKPDAEGESPRLFLYRLFTTVPGYNPWGNAVHASISRVAEHSITDDGNLTRSEDWTVTPAAGGSFSLSLNYTAGPSVWASGEATLYANTNPDAYSIFRYDQLVRVAASAAMGRPVGEELSYNSGIEELSEIFDGDEAPLAILDIPVYVREVYMP
jgi:hypothetical protein